LEQTCHVFVTARIEFIKTMNLPFGNPDVRMVYVIRGESQTGPYTKGELRYYWAVGRLEARDMVWSDGMETPVPLMDFLAGRRMTLVGA
jgi:hypothetical protein